MILFGSCGLGYPVLFLEKWNSTDWPIDERARMRAAATAARKCGFSWIFSEDIAEAQVGISALAISALAIDRRVLNTAAIYFSIYVRGHLVPRARAENGNLLFIRHLRDGYIIARLYRACLSFIISPCPCATASGRCSYYLLALLFRIILA